jgi:hypothetical protein
VRLISSGAEQALRRQEEHRLDIPAARLALETALVEQTRAVADGLLAAYLLRRHHLPPSRWWTQFASRTGSRGIPRYSLPAFAEFRQAFVRKIASRDITPISTPELAAIELRIYSGAVRLWEEARVNRQLAQLGSDIRLANIGCSSLAARHIFDLLGESGSAPPLDARFILGRVAPATICPFGRLFEFIEEYAVSPLLDEAPGMTYERTVVIRNHLLSATEFDDVMTHFFLAAAEGSKESNPFAARRIRTLYHEVGHLTDPRLNPGLSSDFLLAMWRSELILAIASYCKVSRSLQDIADAFQDAFLIAFEDKLRIGATIASPTERFSELDKIVSELRENGVLIDDGQRPGHLRCHLFDSGVEWDLS